MKMFSVLITLVLGISLFGQCFCGTSSEFSSATSSDNCGLTYQSLCTGDSTVACGGFNAISIYERTSAPPPVPAPTPAPAATPTPEPVSTSYMYEGCFVDSKSNRIMTKEATDSSMTAEVCFDLCNDGTNNFFGTQYSKECWCGVDSDLTKNGEEAVDSECDMDCAGTTTGEKCGGFDRMSAYKISASSGYVGCYADMKRNRAMPAEGLYSSPSMTNEMCQQRCSDLGYDFAGTQYGEECWCDDSYDTHGEADNCDYSCTGDSSQICGGYSALSVYET